MVQSISNTDQDKPGEQDIHGSAFFCAPFPMKLHQILEDAEKLGFTSTIAWMNDGESFVIIDKGRLENEIMPRYFMSGKFKSFQRSLNLWGFACERTEGGHLIGTRRYHPLFLRGKLHLCKRMRRTRVKKPGMRSRNKNKEIDPSSSVLISGPATPVSHNVVSTREPMSKVNLTTIPFFAGQVPVQSQYIQITAPCTHHAPTYRLGSSSLRADMQSVVNRTMSLGAPLTQLSTQSVTQMQEDILLRHLIACRVRTR